MTQRTIGTPKELLYQNRPSSYRAGVDRASRYYAWGFGGERLIRRVPVTGNRVIPSTHEFAVEAAERKRGSIVYLRQQVRAQPSSQAAENGGKSGGVMLETAGAPAHPSIQPPEKPDRFSRLQARVANDETWIFRRGMFVALSVLGLAAAVLAFVPIAGVIFIALALVAWGATIIVDVVVRGKSFQDPRFGALMIIAGLGSVIVTLLTRIR